MVYIPNIIINLRKFVPYLNNGLIYIKKIFFQENIRIILIIKIDLIKTLIVSEIINKQVLLI